MKTVIIEENHKKNKYGKYSQFFEWILYMVGYALILITVSILFPKTIQIDNSGFGIWALLAAILINLLNRTIKPVLIWLTLPLTALTLGVFYPFINVLILYIVDVILGSHFTIGGILMTCLVAILISLMNMAMDHLVIQPLLRKE